MRIKPPEKAKPVQMRRCARPECELEGSHRVPKSRESLSEHLWFCLEHARAHNESWDYFNGMNEDQIEAFRVDAMTGHRPTWPWAGVRPACATGSTSKTNSPSSAKSRKRRICAGSRSGLSLRSRNDARHSRGLRLQPPRDDPGLSRHRQIDPYRAGRARLNWPCIRVNLDSHISRIDLIGKDAIVLRDGSRSRNSAKACCPGRCSGRWRWCSTNTTPAAPT
jgi:hypothetical protein